MSGQTEEHIVLDASRIPELKIENPDLWWPNGYGKPNLYGLELSIEQDGNASDRYSSNFGIRKIEYEVADSPYLTISVNGVKIMVRGGDWGLDEAMKRVSRTRLEAQFRMHAQANLNMIRNWVGQSTSPDFYDLADRYGLMLWDEFFQPNPNDGPDVADTDTYLANLTDKFDPRDRASAPLRRLVGEFGEVGYLCALRGGSIVLLDRGLPSRDMAGLPRTGSTAPVLSTAAGRAILAFSSPETAQHLLTSASVSGG